MHPEARRLPDRDRGEERANCPHCEVDSGATFTRFGVYKEGILANIATSKESIKLGTRYNRFSLEFFADQVRGQIETEEAIYEFSKTCVAHPACASRAATSDRWRSSIDAKRGDQGHLGEAMVSQFTHYAGLGVLTERGGIR